MQMTSSTLHYRSYLMFTNFPKKENKLKSMYYNSFGIVIQVFYAKTF